jgi:hypothetical protein
VRLTLFRGVSRWMGITGWGIGKLGEREETGEEASQKFEKLALIFQIHGALDEICLLQISEILDTIFCVSETPQMSAVATAQLLTTDI